MIVIEVNPARVERVAFVSGSPLEEDFDFAAWQAVRDLVDRMDRRLRRLAAEAVQDREARHVHPR